jgi:hypothetical protein
MDNVDLTKTGSVEWESMFANPERVVRLLACRYGYRLCVLNADGAPQPPEPPVLADRASSAGILDRFPREVVWMIISLLDVQSASRLARVSLGGNLLVRSHPEYRALTEHAYKALVALVMTGLGGMHSIQHLHRVLRSDKCARCPEFGPFLFLPTGERCCLQCSQLSSAYQMIRVTQTSKLLGLSAAQTQQLPVLRVPPREYWVIDDAREKGCNIVHFQAARELMYRDKGEPVPDTPWEGWRELLLSTNRRFFGMGVAEMPSVSQSGDVERGVWCHGCLFLGEDRYHGSWALLLRNILAGLPEDADVDFPGVPESARYFPMRARPSVMFMGHAKNCVGAGILLASLEWQKGDPWPWPIHSKRMRWALEEGRLWLEKRAGCKDCTHHIPKEPSDS